MKKDIKIPATISIATIVAIFRILLNFTNQSESFTEIYMNVIYQSCSVDSGLISMFIALILPIAFLITSSGHIADDINTAIAYILPRSKKLNKYFTKKILFILKASFEITLVNNLIILIFCGLKNNFSATDITTVLISLIVQITFTFMISLFVNVTSIVIGDKWSCFVGLCTMIVFAGIINIFKENLIISRLNPIYHYFVQWHDGSALMNTKYEIIQYVIDPLPIEFSIFFMILIILIEIIVGILLLKNKDILIRRR